MRSFCLMLTRLALAAWVGAALFFVMVAIRPLRSHEIPDEVKPHLTQTIFPGYYRTGFSLLGIAWVSGIVACAHPGLGRARRFVLVALVSVLLLLMIADWGWIYSPLADMMQHEIREGQARAGTFRSYHLASRWINSIGMALALIAAGIACWPMRMAPASSRSEIASHG
ncbi:MAG TPA: hypothetical protein VHB77_18275 [Planctomycetaceae bacterium]|nr:hypothetical protein [Planctomycetaceae bacterium]